MSPGYGSTGLHIFLMISSNSSLEIALYACVLSRFSHVQFFVIPWAISCQAPLSRKEYCILQARILEWVSMPSSRGSSWPAPLLSPVLAGRFFTSSTIWVFTICKTKTSYSVISSKQCGILHGRENFSQEIRTFTLIWYQWWWWFSHWVVSNSWDPMGCSSLGSSVYGILQAKILEWVAISFSRGSSWPRNRTRVSCIAGIFFTNWATREALDTNSCKYGTEEGSDFLKMTSVCWTRSSGRKLQGDGLL